MISTYAHFNQTNPTNFVPTLDETATKLMDLLLKHCSPTTLLDPCAGSNALTKHMPADIKLTAYDIEPRADNIIAANFLDLPDVHYDAAVVNPPFNLKKQFIDKCLRQCKYVALISPYKWTMRFYKKHIIDCYHDFATNTGFADIGTTVALFVLTQEEVAPYIDPTVGCHKVLLTDRYRKTVGGYKDLDPSLWYVRSYSSPAVGQCKDFSNLDLSAILAYITPYEWAAKNVALDVKKHWKEQDSFMAGLTGSGTSYFYYHGLASDRYIPVRTVKADYPDADRLIVCCANKKMTTKDKTGYNYTTYGDCQAGNANYASVKDRDKVSDSMPCVPYSKELLDYFNSLDFNDSDVCYVSHLSIHMMTSNLVFDPLKFRC